MLITFTLTFAPTAPMPEPLTSPRLFCINISSLAATLTFSETFIVLFSASMYAFAVFSRTLTVVFTPAASVPEAPIPILLFEISCLLFALTVNESTSVNVFVIFAFKLLVKTDTSVLAETAAPTPFAAIEAVVLSISEFCIADTDTLPPEIDESAIYAFTLFLITFTIPFTSTDAPTPFIPIAPIMPSKLRLAVEETEVDCAFVKLTSEI